MPKKPTVYQARPMKHGWKLLKNGEIIAAAGSLDGINLAAIAGQIAADKDHLSVIRHLLSVTRESGRPAQVKVHDEGNGNG